MLDINLFREEKGHNPEIVRESQRRRFANVDLVDEVIRFDKEWRKRQFELDGLRAKLNDITKGIGQLTICRELAASIALLRFGSIPSVSPKSSNTVLSSRSKLGEYSLSLSFAGLELLAFKSLAEHAYSSVA
ncbi:seryl-tRNA synthetase / serine-tRNA ligase [Actinidia rufa]|uniref:Seryl-tRNA synthetase / serine-tRNA ligase n=1 Tax=Actinidia rufa TaxID=165716 RepID=A0A7J0EY42_9ERIC|nr:seryl-tRNA synthetase / serine-tRNA ligase [Actinidia rufa]